MAQSKSKYDDMFPKVHPKRYPQTVETWTLKSMKDKNIIPWEGQREAHKWGGRKQDLLDTFYERDLMPATITFNRTTNEDGDEELILVDGGHREYVMHGFMNDKIPYSRTYKGKKKRIKYSKLPKGVKQHLENTTFNVTILEDWPRDKIIRAFFNSNNGKTMAAGEKLFAMSGVCPILGCIRKYYPQYTKILNNLGIKNDDQKKGMVELTRLFNFLHDDKNIKDYEHKHFARTLENMRNKDNIHDIVANVESRFRSILDTASRFFQDNKTLGNYDDIFSGKASPFKRRNVFDFLVAISAYPPSFWNEGRRIRRDMTRRYMRDVLYECFYNNTGVKTAIHKLNKGGTGWRHEEDGRIRIICKSLRVHQLYTCVSNEPTHTRKRQRETGAGAGGAYKKQK